MEIEEKLRMYFCNVENIYGEDVAVESATESESIVDSLKKYSPLFEGNNDKEILGELIKKTIVFNDYDFIDEMVNKDEIEELMFYISTNIYIKKAILKNYVRTICSISEISDEKRLLLNKVNDFVRNDAERLEKKLSLKLNKKNEIF